jgi:hypothetical protein
MNKPEKKESKSATENFIIKHMCGGKWLELGIRAGLDTDVHGVLPGD